MSPTPGSAAPTCTSCMARWIARVSCPRSSATRCQARSSRRRRRRRGLVGRRPRHGHAAGLVRRLPRLCRGASPPLPPPELPRASTRPGSMQAVWTCRRNVLVRCRRSFPLRTSRRSPSRLPSPFTTCGEPGLREASETLVVGGGPIGLLIACVARAAGADVLLLEPTTAGARWRKPSASARYDPHDGRRSTVWSRPGPRRRAPMSPSRCRGRSAGLEAATQALAVRGRIVVVAIHATPPPVDLFRVFWRELTLIGARVYERRDFERAVRAARRRRRSRQHTDHARRTARRCRRRVRGARIRCAR